MCLGPLESPQTSEIQSRMRVRIHRGTQQIGGTSIELETQGQRIALDVGLPLDADEALDRSALLPDVSGFREPDPNLLALLISHPHQDHYGLISEIWTDVPVIIGEAAQRILRAAADFIPAGLRVSASQFLQDRKQITLGPFTITPYLVDHSAYDAYALLIEAKGKRLFYSGDFRGHGRKSALFDKLLAAPPRNVDVLLMEGTTLGREDKTEQTATERDLEAEFAEQFRATEGFALVLASGQNIDRLVTIYRAAKRTGRSFIIDLYTAAVLAATLNPRLPQSDWKDVHVFVPHWQRVHVKENELFDVLRPHHAHRVYPERLAELAPKSVLLFRQSMTRDLERAKCLDGARLFYSLWEGYLREPRMQPFLNWLDRHEIPMGIIHTSGHASPADLQRFAKAINTKTLVPIHSFVPERFAEIFDNVTRKRDGEWWPV